MYNSIIKVVILLIAGYSVCFAEIVESDYQLRFVRRIDVSSEGISWIGFDGNRDLIVASADHTLKKYSLTDGSCLWTVLHDSPVVDCTTIGDSIIVSMSSSGTLKYVDILTGNTLRVYQHLLQEYEWKSSSTDYSPHFCIFPSESLFVGSTNLGDLVFIDLISRSEIGSIGGSYLQVLAVQPDYLCALGSSFNVDVYDINNFNIVYSYERVSFVSDDLSIGHFAAGPLFRLENGDKTEIAQRIGIPHGRQYLSGHLVFSGDNRYFVIKSVDGGGASLCLANTNTLISSQILIYDDYSPVRVCIDYTGEYIAIVLRKRQGESMITIYARDDNI